MTALHVPVRLHARSGLLQVRERRAHVLQERFAGGRETHRAGGPLEQLYPQFPLEVSDLRRDGRLCDPQLFGSAGEAPVAHHGIEVGQLSQLHELRVDRYESERKRVFDLYLPDGESRSMSIRQLGSDGLATSAIGFGCMGLSQGYGATDETTAIETIRANLDAGVTLFDTAMSYGEGANEVLLGKALRARGTQRSAVQIATKFGINRTAGGVQLDADPQRIAGWCDASLERLGVDIIDLYYLHRVDPKVQLEESISAMADLVTAGKVRHLGVSEVTTEQLRRAHAVHPIAAVQLEWSLMWREPESTVVPEARRLGVGIVPYSPLGRGLLAGSLDATAIARSPFRSSDPRFRDAALQANDAQVSALGRLAESWGYSPAQLAIAWLLAQGDDVVPIPGSRNPERAADNARTMQIHLSADQLAELDGAVPPTGWAGDRQSYAVPVTVRPAGANT